MNKAQLQLVAGVIMAASTLAASILPTFLPVMLSAPIVTFIGTVSIEVVIYLGTENPQATRATSPNKA